MMDIALQIAQKYIRHPQGTLQVPGEHCPNVRTKNTKMPKPTPGMVIE